MPTRLRLSCRALLIVVLVRPNFYSAGPQASHQLNPALRTSTHWVTLSASVYRARLQYCAVLASGRSSSSDEASSHWSSMKDGNGEQVCRWHALIEPWQRSRRPPQWRRFVPPPRRTRHASWMSRRHGQRKCVENYNKRGVAPGAARRWQFDSRRIYVRPPTGPQSAHLCWPASCRIA